jgi:hypothetical protein
MVYCPLIFSFCLYFPLLFFFQNKKGPRLFPKLGSRIVLPSQKHSHESSGRGLLSCLEILKASLGVSCASTSEFVIDSVHEIVYTDAMGQPLSGASLARP